MSSAPASIEPKAVTAGDTVRWTRSLPDYSAADGWTLKYRLINAGGVIDITASASGADHSVTVTAATSASWTAGTYTWQAYVEKAAERQTVGTGSIEIKRNLAAAASGVDTRSTAAKMVADLEAAELDYASNGQGGVQRYTIGGREMWFSTAEDFIERLEYWRNRLASEQAAESVRQGRGNPRRHYAAFR